MMKVKLTALVAAAVALLGCACAANPQRPAPSPAHSAGRQVLLGVYAPGVPASYGPVATFGAAVGRVPDVAVYYSGWYEKFQAEFAQTAARHGTAPIVQINPRGVLLRNIASGRYDPYLRSYAAAVRRFGRPVIISFGHEMNGGWYPWGWQRTPAATFVAGWRHIHRVFAAEGAANVIWMWTVIIDNPAAHNTGPMRSWWPGDHYVNWVGIDGYYVYPSDTFQNVFGGTIAQVRRFTRDPILIAETGAAPGAGQAAKLADLFSAIRAPGMLGFVYFDQTNNAHSGYHQDWRLEDSLAALGAFRRLAAGLPLWRP